MTAMQELIQELEKDINYFGGPDDCHDDKVVASYLRGIVSDLKEKYLPAEKQQIYMAYNAGDLCGERHPKEEYYNLNYGLPENSGSHKPK